MNPGFFYINGRQISWDLDRKMGNYFKTGPMWLGDYQETDLKAFMWVAFKLPIDLNIRYAEEALARAKSQLEDYEDFDMPKEQRQGLENQVEFLELFHGSLTAES